jgi:hypothetical protein
MNGERPITKVNQAELVKLLTFAILNKSTTLTVGPPGVGKTALYEYVAKEIKHDFVAMYPATSDPTEPNGFPFKGDKYANFQLYGKIAKLVETKKPTVCLLDDFGQATNAVQSAYMNPIQCRRLPNGQSISDTVVFALATNRREDGANVQGILEPIKSKVNKIFHLHPTVEPFLEWWLNQDLPVEVYAYLRTYPHRLWDFKPSKDIVSYPCPRTWEEAGKDLKRGIPKGLEMACLAGSIGDADACDLLSFIEVMKNAVAPDDVISKPETATIPERAPIMFGLMAGLIYKMNTKNFKPILKYATRLGVDFATKLRHDMLVKSKVIKTDITNCAEYGNLVRHTGNVQMAF